MNHCPSYRYSDGSACVLQPGHPGSHRNGSGEEWDRAKRGHGSQSTPAHDAATALVGATGELQNALAGVQAKSERIVQAALETGVEVGILEGLVEAQALLSVAASKLILRSCQVVKEVDRVVGHA